MQVGERIRDRLAELDMSQSELARRVKLTQGTIGGLIIGKAQSSAHLHKIARALRTTPAYLTGETDDPDADAPPAVPLNSDTQELIDRFSSLSAADRRALLQVARSMSNGPPSTGTVHSKAELFDTEPHR